MIQLLGDFSASPEAGDAAPPNRIWPAAFWACPARRRLSAVRIPPPFKAFPLDTGHIQYVEQRHGLGQVVHFRHGQPPPPNNLDVMGNTEMRGGDQHEPVSREAGHGLDKGMHRPSVFQIAAQADAQTRKGALFVAQGGQVGEGLRGMEMPAVSRIDNRHPGIQGSGQRRAGGGVPHGDDVGIATDHADRILDGFPLGHRGIAGVVEADNPAAQTQHGGLKGHLGTVEGS